MRVTITIAGHDLPTTQTIRILTYNDALPLTHSTLEGPEEAFAVTSRGETDYVRVVDPSKVAISRFTVAT